VNKKLALAYNEDKFSHVKISKYVSLSRNIFEFNIPLISRYPQYANMLSDFIRTAMLVSDTYTTIQSGCYVCSAAFQCLFS
jgi:hypothetical protein